MKSEHKNLTSIELSLLTWYQPDNPLYRNLEHPTIKLAGEIGELLDLYAKHKYKPGFDWMNCKWCKKPLTNHTGDFHYCIKKTVPKNSLYTPMVLDELGDIWYYLRILAWMNSKDITYDYSHCHNEFDIIIDMYSQANCILQDHTKSFYDTSRLKVLYGLLVELLSLLDCTIEELTKLNYQKLNSELTNHGWKDA